VRKRKHAKAPKRCREGKVGFLGVKEKRRNFLYEHPFWQDGQKPYREKRKITHRDLGGGVTWGKYPRGKWVERPILIKKKKKRTSGDEPLGKGGTKKKERGTHHRAL